MNTSITATSHHTSTAASTGAPTSVARRLGKRLAALSIVGATVFAGAGMAFVDGASALPSWASAPATINPMVQMVNDQRSAAGLGPVTESIALDAAALAHSQDQAARITMTHTGADGSDAGQRETAQGYIWWAWGENVAAGQPDAVSVMTAWMNSPGHRDNILSPNFTNIGLAVVKGSNGANYWTMDLGSPRADVLAASLPAAAPATPAGCTSAAPKLGNGRDPFGYFDGITLDGNGWMTSFGWAANPQAPSSTVQVRLMYGTRMLAQIASDRDRPDVQTVFGQLCGQRHGYGIATPFSQLGPIGSVHGAQVKVCAVAVATSLRAKPSTLGCQTVTVP